MGVNWTTEQQQVIDLRDRNILVSAAAGSGKTAVLVERIIAKLTDKFHPVDVDRLLIVTFTEAAAAEMKERIRNAIERQLEEEPENVNLQRQATLIHNALITTIHSFCLSVIRDHFHTIDLDPGFRIAEEGELKLLRQDVLGELLENRYESGGQGFLEFVERFATGRDDKKIEEFILQVYDFSRSYPEPDRWLDDCVKAYEVGEDLDQAFFVSYAKKNIGRYLEDALLLVQQGMEICIETDGPYMYMQTLETDRDIVESLQKCDTLTAQYEVAARLKWARLAPNRDKSVSEEKTAYVKRLREEVKKMIAVLCEQYFYDSPGELAADMRACHSTIQVLTGLVREFAASFEAKKRERNLIDFGDMEQFALRILTEQRDGTLVPSPVAKEYQERFEEVMIDEYQDSNLIQEAILTSVSTVSAGKHNVFMVGDVKQSIYRFRLSRPELFMMKFDTYSLEESDNQRIDLHKNFRSRAEVLDSINFIFAQIMTKGLGGITYDEKAALYVGASYEPRPGNETEIMIVDTDFEKIQEQLVQQKKEAGLEGLTEPAEEYELEATARELEARAIAGRIKQLLQTQQVLDKSTGAYRPAAYRDIVILTRSIKGWTDVFAKVLNREGIPTYTGTKEGYFETLEVSVILDYLRMLDNMKQDLPLAAVLASPIVGLHSRDLAKIKIAYPELSFYEAVQLYAQEGDDPDLTKLLTNHFRQARHFRELVPYTAIHELLWHIIEETGYGDYISAMPGGEQRIANLEMLVEKAIAFESTSYKGLFNFVRYIEQLQKYDVDYGEASITDEQADTVRLMSIHKSKGLEFPIVFVAGMSKRFNKQDITGSMILHPELGIGVDAIDLEQRTKIPSFLKKTIQKEVMLENLGEELRVLYVALTRAKEKLIMIGTLPDAQEVLRGFERIRGRQEKSLSFSMLAKANTYFDWVLPALARIAPEIPMRCEIITLEELVRRETAEETVETMVREVLTDWDLKQVFDAGYAGEIENQLLYEYPYGEEQRMKLKFTVSELKKRTEMWDAEEAGELLYEEPVVIPILPKFIQEETVLKGASKGTAYHRVLELLDFTKEYSETTLQEVIGSLIELKQITNEMADCIRIKDLYGFLHSPIGLRVQQAAKSGLLYTEQPFVIGIDAAEFYEEVWGETVLVQGIIDAYFEEEDSIVVLDYKTDRATSPRQLQEKYHAQLDYYATALEQLTGKCVKQKVIYSFALGREIEV